MKAELSTIHQTLTPEAAAVLNRSIAEAARRSHGQTTPLHVAATLLAAPSGLLRQACLRSHSTTSSHPLHTRALDLCFSVALDRLLTITSARDPPLSNALVAALKRAQANQRRGCPEQQQQPLLAVKVDLDQLVVSILDDPGVSRVMREASFSSSAVKATIEQFPSPTSPLPSTTTRNLYMNPRLGGGDQQLRDEVKRVLEILSRFKKRNSVLVGDSDPDAVMRKVLQRIERRELGTAEAPPLLRTARVISLAKEFASADRSQIPSKIRELGCLLETQIRAASPDAGGGVVLDLGDLKWLVESPTAPGATMDACPIQQQIIMEIGRAAVAEMSRLLARFGEAGSSTSRVWVVGTATCATYLRCQVYYPTMESGWDLQAVPISPRSLLSGVFPRLGGNGILSSSIESLAPSKGFPTMATATIPLRRPPEGTQLSQNTTLCPLCKGSYELELANFVAKEFENSSSDSRPEARQALPHWFQIATPGSTKSTAGHLQTKEQELMLKQTTEELMKKWHDTCSRLHPNPRPVAISSERPLAPALPMPSLLNASVLTHQTIRPRSMITRDISPLQVNNHVSPGLSSMDCPTSPPGSPVKTDLALGQPKKVPDALSLEKTHSERIKDFPGCMQDRFSNQQRDKNDGIMDSESLKWLSKGLTDKVSWQSEAASAVAASVVQCKSGNGKRRGIGPKAVAWLLFIGPDKVGKRKMVCALSELVFGSGPVTVRLGGRQIDGDDGESDVNLRGKTPLDRVAEAIRQNPFSLIVLEDVDRTDKFVLGTIKRSMERGRLTDSHGREVGLGSVIFVLTAAWLPDDLKSSHESLLRREEKILNSASFGWQLELSFGEKTGKRRAEWLLEEDQPTKTRKDSCGLGLSLDLNLAVRGDDDAGEGSSDLTVEHEHEYGRLAIKHPAARALITELIDSVDDTIVFKPVDFSPLRRRVSKTITTKFMEIMGSRQSIRIDEDALDQLVGGVWLGGAPARFEEWAERVLVPSIQQLRSNVKVSDGAIARLSWVNGGGRTRRSIRVGDWLPSTVTIAGL